MRRGLALLAVVALVVPVLSLSLRGRAFEVEDADPLSGGSVVDAARTLYGNPNATVKNASDAAFVAAFPNHKLYGVEEPQTLPPETHAMAWDPLLSKAYDLTKGFNTLLSDAAVVIALAADAVKFAKAYAQVANAELQVTRRVVTSADSEILNVTIADPAATQT